MKKLPVLGISLICVALISAPADAGWRRYAPEGRVVTAHSDFGNGSVSGRVRRTRVGRQVQLPGGNWIHCGLSCAETLRVQTVDFWEWTKGKTHDNHLFGRLRIR